MLAASVPRLSGTDERTVTPDERTVTPAPPNGARRWPLPLALLCVAAVLGVAIWLRQPPPRPPASAAGAPAVARAEDAGPPADGVENVEPMVLPATAEGVRAAVLEARPEIARCFAGWQPVDAGVPSLPTVSFRVAGVPGAADELPRVTAVTVSLRGVRQPSLERCLLAVLSQIRFEASAGAVLEVSYPGSNLLGAGASVDAGVR